MMITLFAIQGRCCQSNFDKKKVDVTIKNSFEFAGENFLSLFKSNICPHIKVRILKIPRNMTKT